MYKEIRHCRLCNNSELIPILSLGEQQLTGIFPRSRDEKINSGPLELVKCNDEQNDQACGCVQLRYTYDSNELYGDNYGYRSGLNQSMVRHLHKIVDKICNLVSFRHDDLIIDIGSNDSTLLQGYPSGTLRLVGVDPTGSKFKQYYPTHIQLIPDFFSSKKIKELFGDQKAKVITSISMFYDLESPLDFVHQVYDVLADDGVWVLEQSYMPQMLAVNAYDTICHEHLEYYGLKQILWLMNQSGLKILDVEMNDVNGGSFSVMVAKQNAPYPENSSRILTILREEEVLGLRTLKPFEEFKSHVFAHRDQLIKTLSTIHASDNLVLGYGASTKGNVILQFCQLTAADIPFIAEINQDKFGCYTPGTLIPIISEAEAHAMKPDYFVALPWHFRENILAREKEYLIRGGKFLFPLPFIDIVKG